MYQIIYSNISLKDLRKIPRNTAVRITRKIELLAKDPYAINNNVGKLQGREGYRLRVDDWRIIYSLDDIMKILSVEKIGARGGVYQ